MFNGLVETSFDMSRAKNLEERNEDCLALLTTEE
jgi:hypothetical protein